MYAFRPGLFRPVDPLMFCDDVIPVRIALDGYLTLYHPDAWCVEEAVDEAVERRRRRRHASFGLRTMLQLAAEALRKGRFFVLYQCVSHRVLRWLGGLALAGILVSSIFLASPWKAVAIAGQAIFYGAAAAGLLASRSGLRMTLLYLPYYFLVITGAGLGGLAAFLRGTDTPYWEPRK